MSYNEAVSNTVKVIEAVGVEIMVIGGLVALALFVARVSRADRRADAYPQLRRNLARCILLGLEVLIVADIVRTVIVEPTFESVTVLGGIVVIRILLSFALEIEIEGTLPWDRWRRLPAPSERAGDTG